MSIKSFKNIIFWTALSITPIHALAADALNQSVEKAKVSKTISYQKNDVLDDSAKLKMLKEANKDTFDASVKTILTSQKTTAARHQSFDYSLFDASTDLISDFDYDGFYHRFAVTIDVDTLFEHATVYAELYLSYEGGPWIYYASSNDYDIHTDSIDDAFTIETELSDGYPTGYYDMRIKLYDSDTDEYLLTYDSFDDTSLRAIPLEDSFRDDDFIDTFSDTEVFVTHGGGSINLLSLFILCVLLGALKFKQIFLNKQDI